jgi:hypothetical protein
MRSRLFPGMHEANTYIHTFIHTHLVEMWYDMCICMYVHRHTHTTHTHLVKMRRNGVRTPPEVEVVREVELGIVCHLRSNVELVDHVATQ